LNEKKENNPSYLLDTSVLIAYLAEEKGGEELEKIKKESAIPFIALSELYYLTWQKQGKEKANETYVLVKGWQLPILYPDEHIVLLTGEYKVKYGFSIADSYIAAFAFHNRLTLVTKDPEYKKLAREMKIKSV